MQVAVVPANDFIALSEVLSTGNIIPYWSAPTKHSIMGEKKKVGVYSAAGGCRTMPARDAMA
jgi:hypothetical protein